MFKLAILGFWVLCQKSTEMALILQDSHFQIFLKKMKKKFKIFPKILKSLRSFQKVLHQLFLGIRILKRQLLAYYLEVLLKNCLME